MKKIIFLVVLMIASATTAQITYKGVVKDSLGNPLEMANVIALDTVAKKITSFGFTDAKGNYKLELNKNSGYTIKISYIGFKEISTFVNVQNKDIVKNYTMYEDTMLNGIEIVSKMPVTIKGDTIIYDADSFKNGSERKLEDVLEKLPGVEINDAGEIEVEGKVVEKIMVDGKEFFSGDTKLASKNIPSNAVDKIQVLRNYSSVSQLSGVQSNQDRVAINIKLKEGKTNFWFGDVTAGIGNSPNTELYLFQPKLFYYSPKYTLNVIGDLNNIGDVVLSRRDVRSFGGGFRSESPSNGTNINIADAGIGFLSANARNANSITTKLSALNFSYSPSKKLDVSGFLIWSGNSNGQKNVNSIDYIDINTPDDVINNSVNQTSNTGLFRFNSTYKKDFNNQLNYAISGRFSNEFKTEKLNSSVLSDISEIERATPFKINQDFSYFYTANEKNIFALEAQHLLQDEDPFYVASLENDPTNNEEEENDGFDKAAAALGLDSTNFSYELEQDRRVKSNQLDAKLDYYYILNKKSNLNFVTGTIVSVQNFDSKFFQILDDGSEWKPNPAIQGVNNPQTINDTEYKFTDIYAGLRYRLKSGIFTFTPGVTIHSYNARNTQYGTEFFEDKFEKFLPEFEMIMQFKKSESLTFRYKQEVNFTDVNQIARGMVANNYNSFFTGTSDLTNASFHNYTLNYRNFNLFNNSSIFARVNYKKTIDQVATSFNFIPNSVVSTRGNLNAPFQNETLTAFGRIGKSFRKIRTSLGGNFTYNKNYRFTNNVANGAIDSNEITLNNYSVNTRVGTNFTKAPNVSVRYNVSFTNQEDASRPTNIKSIIHAPSVNFDAYLWDSLTLRSDFTFNEVRQDGNLQNSFKIWNATLAYRKNSDAKWEYELVGSNLLATGSRTSVSQNNFSFNVNETFILPRFISLRMRYQL